MHTGHSEHSHGGHPSTNLEEAFGRARFSNREVSRLDFADRLLDLAGDA